MNSQADVRTRNILYVVFVIALLITAGVFSSIAIPSGGTGRTLAATYVHGILRCTIPYRAADTGDGELTVEVLDPEDQVLGRVERHLNVAAGGGLWVEDVELRKSMGLDDLVWQRLRYRFEYDDNKSTIEGTESISTILRMPVVHILGQQAYLSGGEAAVRIIVTDSQNETINGPGSVRVQLVGENLKAQLLFTGKLNRRGTTQAQFRFPSGLVGNYQLKYSVETEIGSTEFTQGVRLEDKASIL